MRPGLRRRLRLGLALAAAGLTAGGATLLGLQLLLATRLEQAALLRLSQSTAFSLRLADLALERYPRDAVAAISGLDLAAAPPLDPGPLPARVARQGRLLRRELCRLLEGCPRLVLQARPWPGAWVEMPSALEPAWLFTPLPRTRLWPPSPLVCSLGLLAAGLVATTLYLELEVRRPLSRLGQGVNALDPERRPAGVAVEGNRAVRQLTRRFNAMVERLARHRRERATMLAGIAHDLRSPITRLQLRLALAEQRALPAVEAARAQADLDAISRITGQFMAFAAGSDAEAPLPVNLAELVGQALAGVEGDLQLELLPLQRRVQPIALSRAVANLVENAVSHGQLPLLVRVGEPEAAQADGGEGFRITVADCGAGIPAARWQQALEPFQRLDPARGGSGHCGLGLAIAAAVARGHGGDLSRQSLVPTAERPQTFAVTLSGRSHPVTTPPAPVTAQSQRRPNLDLS